MAENSKMKMTEMGLIPSDWEICSIGREFSFLRNNSLSRDQLNYSEGNVKNVHYGDILVVFGEVVNVQKERLPYINKDIDIVVSPKNMLQDGDIIIADTAEDETAGKACEIQGVKDQQVISGLHTIPISPSNRSFAPGFLGYAFNSSLYHDQLRSIMQGTKVVSVSKRAIQETFFIFPSYKAEQGKISAALSGIDTLISDLDKVITKKKLMMTGSMQLLLSGKKRLKGFSRPWVELELGELGKLTGAGVDKTVKADEKPVRLLNFLDVYNRDRIYNHELKMWVTASDYKIARCDVKQGDIFLTPSSELPNDIGRSAVAMSDMEGVCYSYHVLRLRPSIDLDMTFSAYMLKTAEYEEQIRFLSEGSGKRYVISLRNFREIRISIPDDIREQNAIGNVIAAMDNEIRNLEAERDKYKNIKQGMMQKLLTGQIRLPV